MTELNIAYSYNGDLMDNNNLPENYESADLSQQYQQPLQQQQQQQSQQQQQQSQQQPQQPPQLPQQIPVYQQPQPQSQSPMFQQQSVQNFYSPPQQPAPKKQYQRTPEYSFWDRMAMSRNDVLKLFILSLIVVLGISIDRIGSHYIKQYLTDNILSPIQEFIIRLSYPVIIFLFLWIIKSL